MQKFVANLKNSKAAPIVSGIKLMLDMPEVKVKPENLIAVLEIFKSDPALKLDLLLDICAVDYPNDTKRFVVVYHLLSLAYNYRVRIKVAINEGQYIPSCTGLFMSANWYEREVWDLFGIKFQGHDDLRRILTDYGFVGHPLRKDFPLTGFKEVRYDAALQKVVYEDVFLTQEYRDFDTLSPWEGSTNKLPGDEKATK